MNTNEPQRSHAEIWILLAFWGPYSTGGKVLGISLQVRKKGRSHQCASEVLDHAEA